MLPFKRTVCDCRRCSICCEHIPGTFAPSDLPAIASHLGYSDPEAFARDSLLAGEGATLKLADGRIITLQKLVPKRGANNHCIFYKGGRCTIHPVSPFGCSYFDAHMSDAEFALRHNALSTALLDDLESGGAYTRTTATLRALGHIAQPDAQSKAGLATAMRNEKLVP